MSGEKRIVVPMEQAIDLLNADSKGMVRTFHQVNNIRVHADWPKESVIECMAFYSESFGGVELSGEIARTNHFGLCAHRGDIARQLPRKIVDRMPLGWLFIATRPGVCCRCGGTGRVARMSYQILPDRCRDCSGTGTYAKAGESAFIGELARQKGGK
jgi:hypothetical protein